MTALPAALDIRHSNGRQEEVRDRGRPRERGAGHLGGPAQGREPTRPQ